MRASLLPSPSRPGKSHLDPDGKEWQNGRVQTAISEPDYDRSIHTNPDGLAWAKFFVATVQQLRRDKNSMNPNGMSDEQVRALVLDEGYMLGWFSNAMMAMHDNLKSREEPGADRESKECRDMQAEIDRLKELLQVNTLSPLA